MSEEKSPDQIIKEYQDAYFAANGRTIQVDYYRGWYAIYSGSGFQTKRRARDLIAYTKTLNYRARTGSDL